MFNSSRRNMRFPALVETVRINSTTDGRVLDESFSGTALTVEGPVDVIVGEQVDIEYNGADMPAFVRRISEQADGSWVIGCQWK